TYYAAMGIGLVCHTLNPRLTPAHLAAMINEAEDRVIVVAADLLPVLRDVLADCPEVAHVVVIDAPLPQGSPIGTHPARLWAYDDLLERHGAE
ncbi:AMP-binding protein, partial [Pseudomonas sp. MPR-AND1A]|uniref:AMP-binding protein n=2 Tax=Pseudomonadota TaxID=1224 RepID=UPI000CB759DA